MKLILFRYLTLLFLNMCTCLSHAQMSGGLGPLRGEDNIKNSEDKNRIPQTNTSSQTSPISSKLVQSIQETLNNYGFNAGQADGFLGPQTKAAIIAAQGQIGLEQSGIPSQEFLNKLIISNVKLSTNKSNQFSCDSSTANHLTVPVSEYIKKLDKIKISNFTNSNTGSVLSNPTVTWRIRIRNGRADFLTLIHSSGNLDFDWAVQDAIKAIFICTGEVRSDFPWIDFRFSLF